MDEVVGEKLDLRAVLKAFETVLTCDADSELDSAVTTLLDAVVKAAHATKITFETWQADWSKLPRASPPTETANTELGWNAPETCKVIGSYARCVRLVASNNGIRLWPDTNLDGGGVAKPTHKPLTVSYWLKADSEPMKSSIDLLRKALSKNEDAFPEDCQAGDEDCLELDLPYLVRLLAAALIELRRGNFESVVGSVMYALSAVANAVYISDGSAEFRADRRTSLVFCQSRTPEEDGFLIEGELSLPDEFGTAAGSTFIQQKVLLKLEDSALSSLRESVADWVNPPPASVRVRSGSPPEPPSLGDKVLSKLWNAIVFTEQDTAETQLKEIFDWLNSGMRFSDPQQNDHGARVHLAPEWSGQRNDAIVYVLLNLNPQTRARLTVQVGAPNETFICLSEAINQVKVEAQKPRQ